jgi:hypothetical protein
MMHGTYSRCVLSSGGLEADSAPASAAAVGSGFWGEAARRSCAKACLWRERSSARFSCAGKE